MKTKIQHKIYSLKQRKLDTRNKIMMGGLVIKAELDYLWRKSPFDLFKALQFLKKSIDNDPTIFSKFSKSIKNNDNISY